MTESLTKGRRHQQTLCFMFTFLSKQCDVSPGVAVYEDEGEICPFFSLCILSGQTILNMAATLTLCIRKRQRVLRRSTSLSLHNRANCNYKVYIWVVYTKA